MTRQEAIDLIRTGADRLEREDGTVLMCGWDADDDSPRNAAVRNAARAVLASDACASESGTHVGVSAMAMLVRYVADMLEL